jgi:hypothetical protein
LLSFLGALAQRRAALEQQRDDIEAVLKEIAASSASAAKC